MTLCNNIECTNEVKQAAKRGRKRLYCSEQCRWACCHRGHLRRVEEQPLAPQERRRNRITVTFTDAECLALLNHVEDGTVSEWARDAIACQMRAEADA